MGVAPEGKLFVRTGTADTYHVLSIQNGGYHLANLQEGVR
jgi:hypothetical protein